MICHGIPDSRKLEDGDILNIDVSLLYKGMHADLNETYCVGEVAESSKHLIRTTYIALQKAIAICKPKQMYRYIGNEIQKYADSEGLAVVRSYTGHGVGELFHCAPTIRHYAHNKGKGFMKAGHLFTIEPMINQGTWEDVTWDDDWTVTTLDGQRSAQFEHSLLITPGGVEVLTARTADSPPFKWELPQDKVTPKTADAKK